MLAFAIGADALLCWVRSPSVVAPAGCTVKQTFDATDDNQTVLMLDHAWPESMTIATFLSVLNCAFNGTLPELASPFAYTKAPRFSLGSAVVSDRLPSLQIMMGTLLAIEYALLRRTPPGRRWRVGIVPLLFVDHTVPTDLVWQPLARQCAIHRARHAPRHPTLCTSATNGVLPAPLQTTMSHMDCDWLIVYYGAKKEHALPIDRLRFLFHMPGALKSDLLIAVAGVAHQYETIMFTDEDVVMRFNSTEWQRELRCLFGHIPVLWRPTFRPYSRSIWQWMNADCFGTNVRAVGLGNFTFLEPQVFFARADFFVHYVDEYVVPVFGAHPEMRGIWTLIMLSCFLAQRAFPHAVPCAMTTRLTATHADLHTLRKDSNHFAHSYEAIQTGVAHMPITHHELAEIDLIDVNAPCVPERSVGTGRFERWYPPQRTVSQLQRMRTDRVKERTSLPDRICAPK